MIEHFYHDIEGHMNFEGLYCDAVNRIPVGVEACFVEVGIFRGRSLAFLATQAHNSGKDIFCVGVDIFEDSISTDMGLQALSTIEQVRAPFDAAGLDNVQLLKGLSWDMADGFEDGYCDFVFIDACHDYDAVSKDLAAWWPKVKAGGVFAGHDYSRAYPGVVRAVEEKFGPCKRIASSWIVQKP